MLKMALSAKKPRLALPDPEEMMKTHSLHATALQDVVKYCDRLSSIDLLSIPARCMRRVQTPMILAWLLVKYGLKAVSLLQAVEKLPHSLTDQQRMELLKWIAGDAVKEDELQLLVHFLEGHCEEAAKGVSDSSVPTVFAPPVGRCIECDKRLTSYHSCKVRHFTSAGAQFATKYTLRCQPCGILYNYSQYGNKRRSGFQYYPTPRPCVEASDCALVDKEVLELQCSLA